MSKPVLVSFYRRVNVDRNEKKFISPKIEAHYQPHSLRALSPVLELRSRTQWRFSTTFSEQSDEKTATDIFLSLLLNSQAVDHYCKFQGLASQKHQPNTVWSSQFLLTNSAVKIKSGFLVKLDLSCLQGEIFD